MAQHKQNKPKQTAASRRHIPLPGEDGEEVLELLMAGKTEEAITLFCDAFIAGAGESVHIEIVEDDGDSMIFVSNRGPFKVYGPGRTLLLGVKAIIDKGDFA